jgi:hypothetical protein
MAGFAGKCSKRFYILSHFLRQTGNHFAGKCSKRFYILSHVLRQTGNHFAGKCFELLITFEMFAQLVDRAKPHGPLS